MYQVVNYFKEVKLKILNIHLLLVTIPPAVYLLIVALIVVEYLTARNAGLYPMIFGDEWLYSAYSRYLPVEASARPLYLYYALYGVTNYCGDAFLDCARQINVFFLGLSLPLIYVVCRRFSDVNVSLFVAVCAAISPISTYTAFFMPESMYFFFFWLFTWFVVKGYEAKPVLMTVGACVILGCLSMVKPHAVFLFPSLFTALFSNWIFDRNLIFFKKACRLAAISIVVFFIVRLSLGYYFAGVDGFNIMGRDYNGYVTPLNNVYVIKWLALASHNFWGHVVGVIVIYGLPITLILQFSIEKTVVLDKSERELRFLKIFTGTLLFILMLIIALYSSKIVFVDNESVERLSMRHYSFLFPLLLIISAASIRTPLKNTPAFHITQDQSTIWPRYGLVIALIGCAIILYSFFYGFSPYTPNFVDSPELLGFSTNKIYFKFLCALSLLVMGSFLYTTQLGCKLFLYLLTPVAILCSAFFVNQEYRNHLEQDVYDKAGLFIRHYFPAEQVANLLVVGSDLGKLPKALFYMDNPKSSYERVNDGEIYDLAKLPEGKEWILDIGDHLKPESGFFRLTLNGYTLVRISDSITVDFTSSTWPGIISHVSGLSSKESWGTWSLGDTVTFEFVAPLPKKFEIKIIAAAFSKNEGEEFVAQVGDNVVKFTLGGLKEEKILTINNPTSSNILKLDIPIPTSPKEVGLSEDVRKLGIGFYSFTIKPL